MSFQIILPTEAEKKLLNITWENKKKLKRDLEQMHYDRISGKPVQNYVEAHAFEAFYNLF